MSYPDENRYTTEHEWARLENGLVTVGITSYAAEQLGDVVFVELPEVGRQLEATQAFGVVEAVKTVSDLFAPLSGEVVEVNSQLADRPGMVNEQPFGDGWMIRIKPTHPEELERLLSSIDYEKLVEEQHA